MYDFRMGCKFIQVTGNPVVKTGSNGKENVTLADRHIGSVSAMHSTVSHI